MDRLIYTAWSGMRASMVEQRVIASNMANAQTIGFRAETLTASPMTLQGPTLETRVMTENEVHGASLDQGAMIETGNPLDIALNGDTMMAVQAEDGSEAYTRRGDLSVDASGVLSNGDGRPVLGDAGPVTVPLGAKISIGPDGQVLAADPQAPGAPPQPVGRIKLASTTGSRVAKGLDGLFRVERGGVLPADDAAQVQVGALEQSNVQPTRVLVQMVEAQRLFDLRTKCIATAREVDQAGTDLMKLS
ncbi:MAG: flagellar basal body rod protein FlgF [Sphingomonadales bacterium]|nr:flagellar basal body rod protein FlgF [Sphingomonadales bacterium]MDE2569028.1 flagellar basal body rod protein FlgF [Sphingomonadales bacterium]